MPGHSDLEDLLFGHDPVAVTEQQVQQFAGLAGDRHGIGPREQLPGDGIVLEAVETEYDVLIRHSVPPVPSDTELQRKERQNTQGDVEITARRNPPGRRDEARSPGQATRPPGGPMLGPLLPWVFESRRIDDESG